MIRRSTFSLVPCKLFLQQQRCSSTSFAMARESALISCSIAAPFFHICWPLQVCQRSFNNSSAAGTSTYTATFAKISTNSEYHNISDRFLDDASIFADALLDAFPVVEDVNISDGVLDIKAPGHPTCGGTFVINKQAPLRQIWYSSPISGPHHFDYNVETKRWVSDRDGHDLQDKIEREMSQVCGKKVSFENPCGK